VFLKRDGFGGGNKRGAIAERAEKLLVYDPALGAPLGAVKRIMERAYKRRYSDHHAGAASAAVCGVGDGPR
jgi:hypothetical protein